MVLVADRDPLVGVPRSAGHAAEPVTGGRSLMTRPASVQGPCCAVSAMDVPWMASLSLLRMADLLDLVPGAR